MLGKKYSLGSIVEETGEARIKLANFDELKTQSDDVASFLNTFSPDSGFVYLHVIAMGAGEYYGCNINGDYFPERDLIARHNTFVTTAKVFKEHDNKPYSPDYGHVVFSWYNPKMHRVELILAIDKIKGKEFIDRQARGEQLEVSMGCFPAGTKVRTKTTTHKNIEDINPGDVVLTHTGEYHKVNTKMLHYFTGNIHTFTIAGQTRKLTATDNHPILVRRFTNLPTQGSGNCPVCGKFVKQVYTHLVRSKDQNHMDYMGNLLAAKTDYIDAWIPASQVSLGDYVLTPIPNMDSLESDIELAKLCGYFLAEGSYIKDKHGYKAIQLNFASDETHLHQDVLQILGRLSKKVPSYQIREAKHVGCISLYDSELANRIYDLCGEYSHSKALNPEIFAWGQESKLALLGAYIDGDGTWNKINKATSITTISERLALDIAMLATTCGIAPSISSIQGKHHVIHMVTFDKCSNDKLAKIASKVPECNYTWPLAKLPAVMISGNYLAHRVQGIAIEAVHDLPVYNLSVDTDESFVTENIAVHNCKVAFDVCSICGNKAKKASDYCNHIRQDKKKIYPDGKQPYMINYNPTFFDISIVRRRADRIAYVLSKVASADASIGNYMADEFENLDKSYIPYAPEPEEAVFDWVEPEVEKAASIVSPRSATLQEKIAMIKRINSGAVKVMNEGVQKLLPALEAQEKDLPVELLDHIARKYSLPDIMRSFALRAIPMKPREFTRIIIVQTGIPKEKFHEVLKGVMQAKPLDRFPDGNYVGEIGSLLDPFLMDRSSFLPALMHRIEELKKQPEKTAAAIMLDPIGSYLDLDARLAFGHVRKPLPFQDIAPQVPEGHAVVQKDPYALTPVVMNAKALEEERRRPKLKDPVLGPVATGMTLGAIFAAYKNSEAIRALAADPKAMAILAAAAALIHHKARVSSPAAMQQKTASALGWGAKIGIPFVGAHFLAAHYRNLYNNGRDLNAAEQYVAENPDVISVAAPIALHYGLKKHANISDINLPDISDVLGIEKIAELSDTAADAARNVVSGIILRGKNRSVLSSVIDQTIDSHILNTLMGSE